MLLSLLLIGTATSAFGCTPMVCRQFTAPSLAKPGLAKSTVYLFPCKNFTEVDSGTYEGKTDSNSFYSNYHAYKPEKSYIS